MLHELEELTAPPAMLPPLLWRRRLCSVVVVVLDIIVKNSITRDVLMSMVTPWKQLVMALVLELFVIYIFSFYIVSFATTSYFNLFPF